MILTDKGIWKFWMTNSQIYPMSIWICRKCGDMLESRRNRLPKKCPYCGARMEDEQK